MTTGHSSESKARWRPDEWVCSHYQRRDFGPDDLDVFEHLGHCYPPEGSDWLDPQPSLSGSNGTPDA